MENSFDPALDADAIARFVRDGFVRVDAAFSSAIAAEARAILWAATGCDPDDSTTWTRPVIRLEYFDQGPFREAANTTALHSAFDQLVGKGRWLSRGDSAHFLSASLLPKNPETMGGTSTSASVTRNRTSWTGGPM